MDRCLLPLLALALFAGLVSATETQGKKKAIKLLTHASHIIQAQCPSPSPSFLTCEYIQLEMLTAYKNLEIIEIRERTATDFLWLSPALSCTPDRRVPFQLPMPNDNFFFLPARKWCIGHYDALFFPLSF